MARSTRRVLPFLLLGVLVFVLGTRAGRAARADEEPAPEPAETAVPEGPPVQLDGVVLGGEWEGALTLSFGPPGTHLRLRQCRGTLLLAFASPLPWPRRASLTLFVSPDGEEAGMDAPGAVRINYEPLEHDRSHVLVSVNEPTGPRRVTDRVVARRVLAEHACSVELACDLGLLGVTADDRAPRRVLMHWSRPHADASASWPEGLDLVGRPPAAPPDLASARRWGRLGGWGDPRGAGAFPPSEFKAWLEQDREIAVRGATAHGTVREITEEWKKTAKQDTEQEAEVLDNLAWIAALEPLTPNDGIALATVLRFLNRNERARGLLDALVQDPEAAVAQRALYERALTFESMERFPDAAADWGGLAARVARSYRGLYERKAEAVTEKQGRWVAEQEARAADDARGDLPLVGLRTSRGLVVLQLYAADVPVAVKHFLDLVDAKFYDGTLFHRVLGDFMAQGGDPVSRDQGCEFAGSGTSPTEVDMELNPRHGFWRGAVGFARKMRESNGSQFFIMTAPRPDLGEYTCFGRVVSGMEHVDRLERCDTLHEAMVLRR